MSIHDLDPVQRVFHTRALNKWRCFHRHLRPRGLRAAKGGLGCRRRPFPREDTERAAALRTENPGRTSARGWPPAARPSVPEPRPRPAALPGARPLLTAPRPEPAPEFHSLRAAGRGNRSLRTIEERKVGVSGRKSDTEAGSEARRPETDGGSRKRGVKPSLGRSERPEVRHGGRKRSSKARDGPWRTALAVVW